MIKILLVILLALPLVSFAPVPRAPMETGSRSRIVTRHSSLVTRIQPCSWETAPARLRQQIEDPIGYPFGMVEAWSCSGDSQAVIAELAQRAATMQAAAAAYRQAHPIGGTK